MKVFIEIPAWSFKKVHYDPETREWKLDFNSPFPCPFNYGFCEDRKSEDDEPVDVIVIGRKLRAGSWVEVRPELSVDFLDRGERDPKLVARLDGRPLTTYDLLKLQSFMTVFTAFKRLRGLLEHGESPRLYGVRGYRWLPTAP